MRVAHLKNHRNVRIDAKRKMMNIRLMEEVVTVNEEVMYIIKLKSYQSLYLFC